MTPSMMNQRDDEIENMNCAVGFMAPPMSDPRYVSMLLY